ncbi:MAG: hypothetical protein ACI9LG_000561 [Moritella dasanensis]|jgi:hypothetical protein
MGRGKTKPRGSKIAQILREQGADDTRIHVEVVLNGVKTNAIDDATCLAILEYYAFDATSKTQEIADLMVSSVRQGLIIDDHVVPDISVGSAWSKHWTAENFEEKYGARSKHKHVYPDYFPQAKAGAVPVNIYPLAALGEFRTWFESTYLPEKFPTYIKGQIKKKTISVTGAELLLEAVVPKSITVQ